LLEISHLALLSPLVVEEVQTTHPLQLILVEMVVDLLEVRVLAQHLEVLKRQVEHSLPEVPEISGESLGTHQVMDLSESVAMPHQAPVAEAVVVVTTVVPVVRGRAAAADPHG
jgi:hypothetical protein